MHVYQYTVDASAGNVPGGTRSVKTTLYVGGETGLPRRIVLASPRGDQTLDYYDYGAPIAITLPPCAAGS